MSNQGGDDNLFNIFRDDQMQEIITTMLPLMRWQLAMFRALVVEGATMQEAMLLASGAFRAMLDSGRDVPKPIEPAGGE